MTGCKTDRQFSIHELLALPRPRWELTFSEWPWSLTSVLDGQHVLYTKCIDCPFSPRLRFSALQHQGWCSLSVAKAQH
jgi:hypothetical protein